MSLKPVLSTKDEVEALPEAVRSLYEEVNGKWVLPVEGVVPESELEKLKLKLTEFRDNNVRLLKEADALHKQQLAKFEGVDPDKYKELLAQQEKLNKKGIKDPDEISTVVQTAVLAATKPLADKLSLMEEDRARMKADLDANALREAIATIAAKKGVKQKALPYVLDKAKSLFKAVDGKVVAQPNVFSDAHPTDPLTTDEWLDALAKSDDFLFEPSQGGGAGGGPAGGGRPGVRQLINPTPEEMGQNLEAIAKGLVQVVRR